MSTTTTNYGFVKPEVNSAIDEDLWGGQINANFDAVDTQLKAVSDATVTLAATGGTINGVDIQSVANASTTRTAIGLPSATQAEMIHGTETELRAMSPYRVAQAIAAIGVPEIAHFAYRLSAGTGGGAGTTALTTHELNTTVSNNITGCSLASNVVTLPAGTYIMRGYVMCFGQNAKAVVRDLTASSNILLSSSDYVASATTNSRAEFEGSVTFTVETEVCIQSIYTDSAVNRKGYPCNLGGLQEEYASLFIEKIA